MNDFNEWLVLQAERLMQEWICTGPGGPAKIRIEKTKEGVSIHLDFNTSAPKVRIKYWDGKI
jgi:hypothetical protein